MFSLQRNVLGILVLATLLAPASAAALGASQSIEVALTSGLPLAGANLDFTITANNEGPDSAANVAVTVSVTANATFVSRTVPAGWSCSTLTPGTTGTIACTIASFAPGSVSFTLTIATVPSTPQGTPLTVPAAISSTTPDPDSDDNSAELTVLLVWQSNLAVAKSGPASAFTGAQLVYTISITNPGPSNAADLVVTDTFAAPVRFVSVAAPGWTCLTPGVGSSGIVSCSNPQIPVGVTDLSLTLDTAPSTAPTSVINDVSVSASSDPVGPRVSSATTALTASADLTIAITDSPDPVGVLGTLTYQVVVSNGGPSDAINPNLSVPLDSALRFVSLTSPGGWTCTTPSIGSAGTVSCQAATLASGASATFTIVTTVFPPAGGSQTVSTSAATVSGVTDPNLTNNSATAITTLTASGIPALSDFMFLVMAGLLALVAVLRLRTGGTRRT